MHRCTASSLAFAGRSSLLRGVAFALATAAQFGISRPGYSIPDDAAHGAHITRAYIRMLKRGPQDA
jgi:hypothetical protein